MGILKPILAPFKGLQLCLFDAELRNYALRPWGIGVLIYITLFTIAFYFYSNITALVAYSFGGGLGTVSDFLAWIGALLLVLVATVFFTFIGVLILCAYSHNQIAQVLLIRKKIMLKEITVIQEIGRTSLTETVKLIWLIPLYIFAFLLGLIPIFTPFAFILGSILLAYQFFDYPLDNLHFSAFKRLGFLFKHIVGAVLFGGTLILLGLIPFLGFFLPPIAVAGASWLILEENWLQTA
jgi:CysZ protein